MTEPFIHQNPQSPSRPERAGSGELADPLGGSVGEEEAWSEPLMLGATRREGVGFHPPGGATGGPTRAGLAHELVPGRRLRPLDRGPGRRMSCSRGTILPPDAASLSTASEARAAPRAEIVDGLAATPPSLPPKLFYDEVGALLFEEITRLPEYYPTRTELGILRGQLPEIARWVGPRARVVEFGSGSGEKIRWLLESLDRPASYTPVDIAAAQLEETARRLETRFPELEVTPLAADYTRPFTLPKTEVRAEGTAVLFLPGSTIGNFEPDEARQFLDNAGATLGPGARLIIGVDLVKPRELLEAAYNDAQAVTARFNLNALTHVNRELGSDFDVSGFRHRAVWNAEASRIEMHLVATKTKSQHLTNPPRSDSFEGERTPSSPFSRTFEPGQYIVTEHSYKYNRERFETLLITAGWTPEARWVDRRGWFAVHTAHWSPDRHE